MKLSLMNIVVNAKNTIREESNFGGMRSSCGWFFSVMQWGVNS